MFCYILIIISLKYKLVMPTGEYLPDRLMVSLIEAINSNKYLPLPVKIIYLENLMLKTTNYAVKTVV